MANYRKLGANLDAGLVRQINTISFDRMEISKRAKTGLHNGGFYCFGDLNWPEKGETQLFSKLLLVPGMGEKSAREIITLLKNMIGKQEAGVTTLVEVPLDLAPFVKNNIRVLAGIAKGELEVIRKISIYGHGGAA